MPRELYVYYRVAPQHADALRLAVCGMQDRLRRTHSGLQARLLRRTDATSGAETWMETYAMREDTGDVGVDEVTRARIEHEAAAWQHLCAGPRHTEVFEPCA